MSKRGDYVAFRPRRRAFAGRKQRLLSLGGWGVAAIGAAFGAVVTAGWIGPEPGAVLDPVTLVAPPPLAPPDAGPFASPEALSPVPASAVVDPGAAGVAAPEPFLEPESLIAENPPSAEAAVNPTLAGRAAKIVDGDTFYLEGVETRLRLWGVDAPEKNEPGAAEATEALSALVAGRTLACEEMDRDRYKRIVARCTLDDGRDIARGMIDAGAATEMLRYSGGYYGG